MQHFFLKELLFFEDKSSSYGVNINYPGEQKDKMDFRGHISTKDHMAVCLR